MGAQQGQHPVFGPDLPGQQALEVGEADKALEQMDLPLQVAHRLAQGEQCVVGELPEHPKLRHTHMPQRYWETMTEFQGEDYFRPAQPEVPGSAPLPGGSAGEET